jgi:hypothetical protein
MSHIRNRPRKGTMRGLVNIVAVGLLLLAILVVISPAAQATPVGLYDATAGGTPDSQNMIYAATNALFQQPPVAASQTFTNGLTELTTKTTNPLSIGDYAGYTASPSAVPELDRTLGFTLTFGVQIVEEQHNSDNRAGFSVTILDKDRKGIEIGFWEDRVWAQDDDPLFTRAEETLLDTTPLITYTLEVIGETYTLKGGGATLTGAVRDYSASVVPVYSVPNLIFLGDNSSSAGAIVRIASVAVEQAESAVEPSPGPTTDPEPGPDPIEVYLPLTEHP